MHLTCTSSYWYLGKIPAPVNSVISQAEDPQVEGAYCDEWGKAEDKKAMESKVRRGSEVPLLLSVAV